MKTVSVINKNGLLMTNTDKIRELIAQGEVRNTNVEFKKCKSEVGQSVYETICAFLNRNGGDVLLGVDDDGTLPELTNRR